MNIPQFNISEYIKCSNCTTDLSRPSQNTKIYYSNSCLHRWCENCYKASFSSSHIKISCKGCNDNSKKLAMTDYTNKPQDEIWYDNDNTLRTKICTNYWYKRWENFETEEEYDRYWEKFEETMETWRGKDINFDFLKEEQTKEELNTNKVKRGEEWNSINKMKRLKDPNYWYNTKIDLSIENYENEWDKEDADMEINKLADTNAIKILGMNINNLRLPKYHENTRIRLVINQDAKIKAGGYDTNKIFENLSYYAKGGFV